MVAQQEIEKVLEWQRGLERHQKESGFKWQVAAEPLLRKMGYGIFKAQHRPFQIHRGKSLPLLSDDLDVNNYLWDHSDYIVKKT